MEHTVSILTSEESFINNYGAALQGMALLSTITDLGYEASVVKYKGGQFPSENESDWIFFLKHHARKLYYRLRNGQGNQKKKALDQKYANEIALRTRYFAQFQKEYIRFSNEKRMTWTQLKRKYPDSDIYVCGSDQIWNPYFKGNRNDPGYFLAFAPKGRKKIAYAPSFGCSDLPEKAQGNLESLLKDFSAISVREKSGVEIVRKYAHREAQWVVDPTLLRTPEQWKAIARKPDNLPDRYILCYRFAESTATQKAIDETAEKLGLPVVSMPLSEIALQDPYQFIFEAGPREFIGLIQNAELVCTDSFHATVFSVLMKTPVCVFLREAYNGGNSMNSRVYSLLDMLELTQLIKTEKDPNEKVLECLHVNYERAHELLSGYRAESMDFLKKALENENEHFGV